MMTRHERLHIQLLKAYEQQLIRTLFYARSAYDEFIEYKIMLHPHTQRNTIDALVNCFCHAYLCTVEYKASEHALFVRSYNIHKTIQNMRHP